MFKNGLVKILVENFLSECENGISINTEIKELESPTRFYDDFEFIMKDDNLYLINNENDETYSFRNLELWDIKVYDYFISFEVTEGKIYVEMI